MVGLVLIFGVLTIASQIMQAKFYSDSDIVTFSTAIDHIQAISIKDWTGIFTNIFGGIVDALEAMLNMFAWDYSFFEGDLVLIKWIICIPMSVILVVSFIMEIKNSA